MTSNVKVWDLHFTVRGIPDMSYSVERGYGIHYHLFDSNVDALRWRATYWPHRDFVLMQRDWHPSFIRSPHVTDHRGHS